MVRTTILTLPLVLALVAAAGFTALDSTAAPPPNLERAIEAQRALAAEMPHDPQVLNDLGNLLVLTGRTDEAEKAYRSAIEIAPDMVAGHYNLGLLLAETGKRKAAAGRFEAVLEHEPDHAWAHYQLGAVHDARGSDSKAVRHYARAFRLDPQLAFREVNPHVIENPHVTEALLAAFRDMPAASGAPKTYEDPSRIVSLMVPDAGGAAGTAAPRQAEEASEPVPGDATSADRTPATATGPRPALPPAAGEDDQGPPEGEEGRVLRKEDLEQDRGLNQAAPGGSVSYPPRGGVRETPEDRRRSVREQPAPGAREARPGDRRQRFVPGTPSTGRLEMELLPGPGEPDPDERG